MSKEYLYTFRHMNYEVEVTPKIICEILEKIQ